MFRFLHREQFLDSSNHFRSHDVLLARLLIGQFVHHVEHQLLDQPASGGNRSVLGILTGGGDCPGLNAVIVGAEIVKALGDVAVPVAVWTVTVPVVAPTGTTAVISLLELTLNVAAAVPLKRTPVTLVKSVPLMVTVAPTGAVDGVKPVMVGRLGVTV